MIAKRTNLRLFVSSDQVKSQLPGLKQVYRSKTILLENSYQQKLSDLFRILYML